MNRINEISKKNGLCSSDRYKSAYKLQNFTFLQFSLQKKDTLFASLSLCFVPARKTYKGLYSILEKKE